MKFLVLFAVLAIAYFLWRQGRLERKGTPPPAARRPAGTGEPQDMVECAVCSVHLPRADALAGPGDTVYCSDEHRRVAGR